MTHAAVLRPISRTVPRRAALPHSHQTPFQTPHLAPPFALNLVLPLARRLALPLAALLCLLAGTQPGHAQSIPAPGSRTILDAHNCYPYFEWWSDRIDRALATGLPVAIEQDLAWYTDPKTGKSWSVVTHGAPLSGHEPTLEGYFFAHVKPVVEEALRSGSQQNWPIITLNLDFKDNDPAHLAAVLATLRQHQDWITTATRTASPQQVSHLRLRPILVLTGESDAQQQVFYDQIPVGEPILLFGAIHSGDKDPRSAPSVLDAEPASNYRRWWNNSWHVVEPEGQPHAGAWTPEKELRLRALVDQAHRNHLWIRFYTLDGAPEADLSTHGWFHGYNFGSPEAAEARWRAAIAAHVDYLASDQYELLRTLLPTGH